MFKNAILITLMSCNCRLSHYGAEAILKMDHNRIHPQLVTGIIKHICTTKPVSYNFLQSECCLSLLFFAENLKFTF